MDTKKQTEIDTLKERIGFLEQAFNNLVNDLNSCHLKKDAVFESVVTDFLSDSSDEVTDEELENKDDNLLG